MKINDLIKKLEKIKEKKGNVEVFFSGPYQVNQVSFNVSDGMDFPEDYDMPMGFKYVILEN